MAKIDLMYVKNYGVKYVFDDGNEVNLDDVGDVILATKGVTLDHFKQVANREKQSGLAWCDLVTADNKKEVIL
jgi:hypothetical protein